VVFVSWKTSAAHRWELTAIQNTSARHSRLALITARVMLALFLIQNHFLEMFYLLEGNALKSNTQVNYCACLTVS